MQKAKEAFRTRFRSVAVTSMPGRTRATSQARLAQIETAMMCYLAKATRDCSSRSAGASGHLRQLFAATMAAIFLADAHNI